ncbi:ester cyclase [Pseudomonas sp. zbq_4]|uniref:ester cyclase n=1 Tax=Pseudomonas TaxID=286 RepID=UPI00370C90EE
MSVEANKKLVRDFYDAIERRDYEAVAQFCHDEFNFYVQVDRPLHGAGGLVGSEKKNFDMFDHFTFKIHELLADEDRVAAYMIFEGVQTRTLEGVPVKGGVVRFSLMMLLRVKDGKILEKRAHFDNKDVDSQLLAA